MKKLLTVFLATALLICSSCLLAGCGDKAEGTDTSDDVALVPVSESADGNDTTQAAVVNESAVEETVTPALAVKDTSASTAVVEKQAVVTEEESVKSETEKVPEDDTDTTANVTQTAQPEVETETDVVDTQESVSGTANTVVSNKKPVYSVKVPSIKNSVSNTASKGTVANTAQSNVQSVVAPELKISVQECMLIVTPNESFSGTYNVIVKDANGTVYTPNDLCVLSDEGTDDTVIDLRLSFDNGVLAEGVYTVSVESDSGVVSNEATWNYTRARLVPTLTISGTVLTVVDAYDDKDKGNQMYQVWINGNGISYAIHGDGDLYTNQGELIGYICNDPWKKTVTFDLSSLPAGTYKICVGYIRGNCDWTCINYTVE